MAIVSNHYVLLCSFVLGALVACSGSSDDTAKQASHEDCEAAYQHLATLRVKSVAKTSALSETELAKHRANFAARSEDELKSCTEHRSLAWAQCVQSLSDILDGKQCED